jgi:hypothetical protein
MTNNQLIDNRPAARRGDSEEFFRRKIPVRLGDRHFEAIFSANGASICDDGTVSHYE